jgi:hypothetical protein
VASTADPYNKASTGVAKSRSSDQGQVDRRDHPGSYRISQEEVKQFCELHEQGLNAKQIAKLTGWGKSAICRHLYHHDRFCKGIHRRWTDDDNQALVDCYAEKGDKRALAESMGRSVKSIHIAMCRYRKAVRADPKKRRTLGVMTWLLRKMKAADIYRELEEQDDTNTTDSRSRPKNGRRAYANRVEGAGQKPVQACPDAGGKSCAARG